MISSANSQRDVMENPRDARLTWATALLFSGTFCFYAFIVQGVPPGSDPVIMFRATASLVERGSVEQEADPTLGLVPSRKGGFTSKYGIGQTLIEAPFYALGLKFVDAMNVRPDPESNYRTFVLFFITSLCVPFLGAGTATAFFRLGVKLGHSMSVSLAASTLLAFATQLCPGSRFAFSEPLAAFCLMGTLAFLFPSRQSGRAFRVAAGFLLGLLAATKLAYIPAGAVVLAAAALDRRSKGLNLKQFALELAPGAFVFAAVIVAYNHARYGVFWEQGYRYGKDAVLGFHGPFLEGTFGLLASSGKGFFFYSPILLIAVPGFFRFPSGGKWVAVAAGGATVVMVVLFGKWWAWHGDWCWGPRFLLPAVPLMALGLLPLLASFRKLGAPVKVILIVLTAASLYVQTLGTLVNSYEYLNMAADQKPQTWSTEAERVAERDPLRYVHFDPAFSPIRGHHWLLKWQVRYARFLKVDMEAMKLEAPWAGPDSPGMPIHPQKSLRPDLWHVYFLSYFPESRRWAVPLRNFLALAAPALFLGLSVVAWKSGPQRRSAASHRA